METIKKIFNAKSNEECKNEYRDEFNLLDGLLAIGYFFFYMILLFLFGLLMFKTDIYSRFNFFENKNLNKFIFYIPISLITILPIIVIMYLRKQSLASIGIKKKNILKSIFLGILFALPFALPTIIIGINKGYEFANIVVMIWEFLYYLLCIGFVEELVFRGFIQTRIRGLIKNKWLGIVIVGLMFGLMHIPFQMLKANMSILQFIQQDIFHLITTMILHIYFVYIYTRDENIVAPTLTHTLINFIPYIFN